MFLKNAFIKSSLIGIFTLTLGVNQSANALLTNPTAPIFLGGNIQPNIMFAVDDSGSMDWEVLLSQGALAAHPTAPQSGNLDISPNDNNEDREFCAGYSVLAYDPAITYTPWIGEDDAGTTFGNASITAARVNPFQATGGTRNLLSADGTGKAMIFGNWVDDAITGTIGAYDAGECPTTGNVGNGFTGRDFTLDTRFVSAADLGTTTTATGPYFNPATGTAHSEQTNFANWYQYYRKREYVLKRAMSQLIDESSARLGLATLHNNNNVGIPIRDMTVAADKEALEDQMFRIDSSNITPLRALLNNVGQYFDDSDSAGAPASLGFTEGSPILPAVDGGECQQNFTVLMSDGFWNGTFNGGPGNVDGGALRTINVDTDNNPSTIDEVVTLNGGPHADGVSDTLADVAMEFYSKDLSTALNNNVPIVATGPNEDKNNQQHMVTYTVAFGLSGTPGLTVPADHDPLTAPPPWPTPVSNQPTTIDDMIHAAYNARGLYLSASNPQDLITSLSNALGNIEDRTASSASTAAVDSGILQTDARVYVASFDPQDFSGSVKAFTIEADGDILRDAGGNPIELWNAKDAITPTTRGDFYTLVNKSGTDTAVNFALGDADLIAAVERPLGPGLNQIPGEAVIDFIRGEKDVATLTTDYPAATYPGLAFRDRQFLLGDIVSGSPTVLRNVNFGYGSLPGAEGSSYPAFLTTQATQYNNGNEVLMVGANDGMVHALSAANGGDEIFSYIPKTLHGELHKLSEPSYTHRFFVNAPGTAADAFISGWQKLYVSALGEGGRGIFALNVTDSTPGSNPVLWEKNSADTTNSLGQPDIRYMELGHIKHAPSIVRLNNGEWGVVVGNGYNSTSERAQLFILNATNGDIIRVFDTQSGGPANSNGMSEPRVLDEDGDRIIDTIYAGDLNGNLWKIDVSANDASNWDFAFNSGGNPAPLFTAVDQNGQEQSITTKPSLAFNPEGGFMLLFGTGKFIEPTDTVIPNNPVVNSFYGLHDRGLTIPSNRTTLVEQDVSTIPNTDPTIPEGRAVSSNPVNYPADQGWYMDFDLANGERIIADSTVLTEIVVFLTFNPEDTPCGASGTSFIMGVDFLNGAATQGAVFDFNNDGTIDDNDNINNIVGSGKKLKSGVIGGLGTVMGNTGDVSAITVGSDKDDPDDEDIKDKDPIQGRTSWRQLK